MKIDDFINNIKRRIIEYEYDIDRDREYKLMMEGNMKQDRKNIIPITTEIKEYKLDKPDIEEIILKSLKINTEPDAFNKITFDWKIENNKIFGLSLKTEKVG